MAGLRHARATSAGGVVHRSSDSHVEIVLVHRRTPPLWALPKGTPDAGETLEETAVRETREETGLQVAIESPLRAIGYTFIRGRTRFHKTVHFFLMRPIGGSTDDHDHEFDEARWFQLEEGLAVMTHPTERSVVEEAASLLKASSNVSSGAATPETAS